jgi:hypothetical protein
VDKGVEAAVAKVIGGSRRTVAELSTPIPSSLSDLGVAVSEDSAASLRSWTAESWALIGGGVRRGVSPSNVAFMDATCIQTARALMAARQEEPISPLGLLDLGTFVTAVCLYERIAFLENELFSADELSNLVEGDVFVQLPVRGSAGSLTIGPNKGTDIRGCLYEIYLHTVLGRLEMLSLGVPVGLAKAVRDGWTALLGATPVGLNRTLSNDSPFWSMGTSQWLTPPLDELSRRLTADTYGAQYQLEGYASSPAEVLESGMSPPIAVSNGRAIFNLAIAEILRLPYCSSVGRLPFRSYLYKEAKRRRATLSRALVSGHGNIVRFLEDQYHQIVLTGKAPGQDSLELPPFLAVLLSRVRRREQLPEVLLQLRKQATPFRKRLEEMNGLLRDGVVGEGGSSKGIEAMKGALRLDARLVRGEVMAKAFAKSAPAAIGSAIGSIALPHSGAPWEAALFLGGGLAAAYPILREMVDDAFFAKLRSRLFRPEYWFMTKLGVSMRAMTNSWSRIQDIWLLPPGDQDYFVRRFEQIAQVRYV